MFLIILVKGKFWNAKPNEINRMDTQLFISSNDLLLSFKDGDSLIYKDYIEKAIQVNGVLKKITTKGNAITFLIDGSGSGHYVLCALKESENNKSSLVNIGDEVTIKGIYKGNLLDAILLECIIIEK